MKTWNLLCRFSSFAVLVIVLLSLCSSPSLQAQEGIPTDIAEFDAGMSGFGHSIFLPLVRVSVQDISGPPTGTPIIVNRARVTDLDVLRDELNADIVEIVVRDPTAQTVTEALDAVQARGMRAILNLTSDTDTDRPWYLVDGRWVFPPEAREALAAAGAHPATFAVYGLHEPFSQAYSVTLEQQYECNALVKQYSGGAAVYAEVSKLVGYPRVTEDLHDGLCDYCGLSAHLFKTDWSSARSLDAMRARIDEDLAIQRERMPSARLVFGVQTFGRATTGHRMPTADEVREIRAYACARGLLVQFYPWVHGSYEDVLNTTEDLWPVVAEGCR